MKEKILNLILPILLTQFSLFTAHSQSNCWKVVKSGYSHSVGIKQDGTMWVWGGNSNGELGNENVGVGTNAPVLLEAIGPWKDMSLGGALLGGGYTIALKEDGTLWSWGGNFAGQLGYGSNNPSSKPVKIGNDSDWKSIATGYYHSVAIKTDGTLWAWGSNVFGQLGNGGGNDINLPIQIGNDSDWVKISAGGEHTIAMKTDGTMWAWGRNLYGVLGIGSNGDTNIPTQIGTDNNWVDFSTGYAHSIAIKADKSLWGWGDNYLGQIGDESNNNSNNPVRVGNENVWSSTSCGHAHTVAIKENGKVFTWGFNYYGQLGNNSFANSNRPIEIFGNNSDWRSVNTGWYNSLALKNDGSLWVWGLNGSGQLGINSSEETFSTPQKVECPNSTSLSETDLTQNISIYPNRVSDVIYFNAKNSSILKTDIYTVEGRLIQSISNENQEINCSHLPNGMYLLRITTEQGIKTFKFIKISNPL